MNPFGALASAAGRVVADAWTAAMLGLWNAGLWLLRLALRFSDSLLTPDLTEHGPGAWLYQVMFWLAGALLLIMAMLQLGMAVAKRDGHGRPGWRSAWASSWSCGAAGSATAWSSSPPPEA